MLSQRWFLVGLAVLGWVCAAPQSATADIMLTSRTSNYGVTFSNNAFAGASTTYQIIDNFKGDQGNTADYTLNPKTLAQGISVAGSGGITISNLSIGIPDTTYKINMQSGSGTVTSAYSVAAETSFDDSWLVAGTANGLNTLELQGDGDETGYSNFPLTVNITLPGNWTTIGTSSGDIQFIGSLDAGWSQTEFLYNSSLNQTTLQYHTGDYEGTNGNIDFKLYGSPVASTTPEPSTLALVCCGAACLGLVHAGRRSRRVLAGQLSPGRQRTSGPN